MATITNWVPEIWAARFLGVLQDAVIWASRANNNYEGEVRAYGDTVNIPQSSTTITVRDYVVDTDIAAAEVASQGDNVQLVIDKQKYAHFYVDDINAAQSRPDIMSDSMEKAARAMAVQIDGDLQTTFNGAYDASRRVAQISEKWNESGWGGKFLDAVIDLQRRMDTADMPRDGRWLIVHPDHMAGLSKYFLTEPADGTFFPTTEESTLRNGFAGRLLGFDLLVSKRVPDGTAFGSGTPTTSHRLYAGRGTEAVTWATQITRNEAYRPEGRFGDAVKMLNVYGSKLVFGSRLFTIEARKSA